MIGLYIFGMVVGLLFLTAALANWESIYGLVEIEAVRTMFGENAARWYCGLGGLALVITTALFWTKLV